MTINYIKQDRNMHKDFEIYETCYRGLKKKIFSK